jgi:hypothetical protein
LVWTISLKKITRNTAVAQKASHGSDAEVLLKFYLEAVNVENHRTSEEMRMVEM